MINSSMHPAAIKLAVFDYILKPIDDEELNDSLKRAVRKLIKSTAWKTRRSIQ